MGFYPRVTLGANLLWASVSLISPGLTFVYPDNNPTPVPLPTLAEKVRLLYISKLLDLRCDSNVGMHNLCTVTGSTVTTRVEINVCVPMFETYLFSIVHQSYTSIFLRCCGLLLYRPSQLISTT